MNVFANAARTEEKVIICNFDSYNEDFFSNKSFEVE